jgi:hypothetical protein
MHQVFYSAYISPADDWFEYGSGTKNEREKRTKKLAGETHGCYTLEYLT